MKGPMGVGKSSISRAIGKRLKYCVIDKDDASDVLLNYLEPYGETLKPYGKIAYEIMFKYVESLLSQGHNVIVDSPARGELAYLNAIKISERQNAQLKILELFCSNEAEWKRRLETRERRAAQVIKDWSDFKHYWLNAKNDFDYGISHPLLKLDTHNPLEENLSLVTKWLTKT